MYSLERNRRSKPGFIGLKPLKNKSINRLEDNNNNNNVCGLSLQTIRRYACIKTKFSFKEL